MAVEREHSTSQVRCNRGLWFVGKKIIGCDGLVGDGKEQQTLWQRCIGGGKWPRTPGVWLKKPQVCAHPVFIVSAGQGHRLPVLEGNAPPLLFPKRCGSLGEQLLKSSRTKLSRSKSGSLRRSCRRSGRSSKWGHDFQCSRSAHPTDPSICSSISRFISTAYSIGSSLTSGSIKPLTIIVLASASESPRLFK